MVQINFAKREVQCKVVYYGPARSGKTANLRTIHERAPEKVRGQLTTIATDTNRTLFFDFLPLNLGQLAGIHTKVSLYAIPYMTGQNAMRLLVLEGVDGIVFVADSSAHQLEKNREAFINLKENLATMGRDLRDIPLIWQWNKSDRSDAMSAADMAAAMNPEGRPAFSAAADAGTGVFTTLKAMTQAVLVDVSKAMAGAPAPAEAPAPDPEPVAVEPEAAPEPVPVAVEPEPEERAPAPVVMPVPVPPSVTGPDAFPPIQPAMPAPDAVPVSEPEPEERAPAPEPEPAPVADEPRPLVEVIPAVPPSQDSPVPTYTPPWRQEAATADPDDPETESEPLPAEEPTEEPVDEPVAVAPSAPSLIADAAADLTPAAEPVLAAAAPIETDSWGEERPATTPLPPVRHADPEPEETPLHRSGRMVAVGGRRVPQRRSTRLDETGWEEAPQRGANVHPVVDRRRTPRTNLSPYEIVPLANVVAGGVFALLSLIATGYLVYVLL